MKTKKQKLYCYVDETGQDTQGELFVVSVVITQEDRDEVIKLLESIESETGKKATKWHKTRKDIKRIYIENILQRKMLKDKIFYSLFKDAGQYKELSVITIATAINSAKEQDEYKASIFIDGLQKSEVLIIGISLRRLGIKAEKVRGVKDESNSIIRLADAIVGFVREYVEGTDYTKQLYKLGIKNKTLQEV